MSDQDSSPVSRADGPQEERSVLDHALRTYGPEPIGKVAIARVWSRHQLAAIAESLKTSASNRTRPTQKDRIANV